MLRDRFKTAKFKNPKVAAAIKGIINLQEEYENLSQGNQLVGILLSMANTFRTDKATITNLLGPASKTTKQKANIITKPQRVIVPNKVTTPAASPNEGCVGCDKKDPIPSLPQQSREEALKDPSKSVFAPAEDKDKTGGPVSLEDLTEAKDWREILNAFNGMETNMREYMKITGIPTPKSKQVKTSTLAKKIFNHIQDANV